MERRIASGRGRSRVAGPLSVLGAAVILWSGCAREETGVVARVGDRAITAEDVRGLMASQPEKAREADPVMEHLQTLVDMELLLLEAKKERIGDSPFFLRRTGRARRDKLVDALEARRLDVTVADDEVARYIEREGYNRAIQLADIMVPDRETAARVLQLIEQGADANSPDRHGDPVGVLALHANKHSIIELLVKAGMDVNIRDRHGDPILVLALLQKHRRTAHLLLDHGANAHATDRHGKSAVEIARQAGMNRIVKRLREMGAKD